MGGPHLDDDEGQNGGVLREGETRDGGLKRINIMLYFVFVEQEKTP